MAGIPKLPVLALAVLVIASPLAVSEQSHSSTATRLLTAKQGGTVIKMLIDPSNLPSGVVEVGEITFAPGSKSVGHAHTSTELFYVLSGELHHVVDGQLNVLTPGMIGFVSPGEEVIHSVPGDAPCKALVIWAPGGESDRIARFFNVETIAGE